MAAWSDVIVDPEVEGLTEYIHINQNEFSYRKHKKQKEEDIAVCECRYDFSDPDSACGDRCLNVLTSTECTHCYCPCGVYCKNQKFQKREYAKTKLFRTEGRGWGLLANENIKAGQFIIEYCGEVISSKEATKRAQAYETQGLKNAYIITLSASESIDASKKGSLARFINHSCQPNCETRKWTVLGEVRVGIFAKQDIPIGTELTYNYNFEWYGGAKIRCLCGAPSCSGFLGAKSRGFQEDTYLWEDGDDRYSVEKIPLYDSAEDEPSSKLISEFDINDKNDSSMVADVNGESKNELDSVAMDVEPLDSVPANGAPVDAMNSGLYKSTELYPSDAQQSFVQKNAMISRIRSNSACRNYQIGISSVPKKRLKHLPRGRPKNGNQRVVDTKSVVLLVTKEARQEILTFEEMKKEANANLESLYNEIRPAIEEHERDSQDSVPTNVAEKWIEGSCLKLKAEFDLYYSIIKNVVINPAGKPSPDNEVKLLTDH